MAPKKNVGRPAKRCNSKTAPLLPTKKHASSSSKVETVVAENQAVSVLHPLQDHSHDFVFATDSLAVVPALPDANVVPGRRCRELKRRDSEEQVLRLVNDKLVPEFGPGVEQKISKDGLWKLLDYMLHVLRALKKEGKYWTKKNWTDVYGYFPLKLDVASLLDPPNDDDDVRPEILVALSGPHHKNPAMRTSESLERFLENVTDLNMKELYGLMTGLVESSIVTKSMHERCYAAIGNYFCRILF